MDTSSAGFRGSHRQHRRRESTPAAASWSPDAGIIRAADAVRPPLLPLDLPPLPGRMAGLFSRSAATIHLQSGTPPCKATYRFLRLLLPMIVVFCGAASEIVRDRDKRGSARIRRL